MNFKKSCILFLFTYFSALTKANIENDIWIFHTPSSEARFHLVTEVRGTPYVSLKEISSHFKLKIKKLNKFEIEIKNPKTKAWAKLSTHSAQIRSSWDKGRFLSRSMVATKNDWHVPIDFGDRVLNPLVFKKYFPSPQPNKPLIEAQVLIDPGHGGNDYGTYLGSLREKDLTLALALELSNELEKLGVQTALTRYQDLFLSLQERTQMARRSHAKVFISLHLNSEPKAQSSGYEIYVLSLEETQSDVIQAVAKENQIIPRELPEGVERTLSDLRASANFEASLGYAKSLETGLKKYLNPFGKGIKTAPFYVLYGVSMPSLLVELGFLNSTHDQKWLKDVKQRNLIATQLAEQLAKSLKSAKP